MRTAVRTPGWILFAALLVLLAGEVLRIYWIMPFPGSQRGPTLELAYALHRAIWGIRIAAGAVALWAAARILVRGGRGARLATVLGLVVLGGATYKLNGPMSADVMFRQPAQLSFASARELRAAGSEVLPPSALVVGIELAEAEGTAGAPGATGASGATRASRSRAYPIRYIGYHHQVRDVVAGQPVMVTYCTVCRTGRVFRPVVDGKVESFRLVGMDHFNAMFEDATTGSWWRQATGEAVVGPRRGKQLEEIPSRQMTWAAWSALHPETDVMRPDPEFTDRYERMAGFEDGTNESALTGRDRESWREKSWVVGVVAGGATRAFDWNELARERVIQDRIGDRPVVLLLGADGASFSAFDARWDTGSVDLESTADPARFRDRATGASWSDTGVALDGPAAGTKLEPLAAYQEFWHSWQTFHPETTARRD